MTDETRKTAQYNWFEEFKRAHADYPSQDNWFEEFKRAYADYPSQDNEGYVPDRGGFKAGFYAAWRFQERKIAEAVQAERERCALIADKFEAELLRFGGLAQARPRDIANAIRGHGK